MRRHRETRDQGHCEGDKPRITTENLRISQVHNIWQRLAKNELNKQQTKARTGAYITSTTLLQIFAFMSLKNLQFELSMGALYGKTNFVWLSSTLLW